MSLSTYTSASIARLFADRSGFHLSRYRAFFLDVVAAFTSLDSTVTSLAAAEADIVALQGGLAWVALTAAAESANNIDVTVQLKNFEGVSLSRTQRILFEVLKSTGADASAAEFRLSETGAGAEVSTTANPRLIVDTSSGGAATLRVHDQAGASGLTVYLKATVVSTTTQAMGTPTIIPLTFDGA